MLNTSAVQPETKDYDAMRSYEWLLKIYLRVRGTGNKLRPKTRINGAATCRIPQRINVTRASRRRFQRHETM